jgi:DNA-binding transcriptional regulator YiaG
MRGARRRPVWDGARVRELRRHLDLTQEEMASNLGIRQQTVSEWECEVYQPRGASATLLSVVAERAGFSYQTGGPPPSG